jgi:hypothetical protein
MMPLLGTLSAAATTNPLREGGSITTTDLLPNTAIQIRVSRSERSSGKHKHHIELHSVSQEIELEEQSILSQSFCDPHSAETPS